MKEKAGEKPYKTSSALAVKKENKHMLCMAERENALNSTAL